MLKIKFGFLENEIGYPDSWFDLNCNKNWLLDKNIKEMIEDIDTVTVNSDGTLYNHVLGPMSIVDLPTGIKNLIIAYKTNEIISGSYMGDNCAKWILKFAEEKDITMTLCHGMIFPDNIHALILNSNKKVHNLAEYAEEAIKGLQEVRTLALQSNDDDDDFESYFQDYDEDDDF